MTRIQPERVIARQAPALPSSQHHANDDDNDTPVRIDADLLIPGRGKPIHHGTLVFSISTSSKTSSKILQVGTIASLPHSYASLPAAFQVPVLMPGLWDCHVHFFGEAVPNLEHIAVLPPALAGFRAARDVVALLDAGFTSVREGKSR